jgi:hypothetical protein
LKQANLTTHQRICLAEAVIEESLENEGNDWLWPALKKLNKLRNEIAHNLSSAGIDDQVTNFCKQVPRNLKPINILSDFQAALWVACSEVHQRINPLGVDEQ